jgi:DNA-binding MarR family transcriptional regulator
VIRNLPIRNSLTLRALPQKRLYASAKYGVTTADKAKLDEFKARVGPRRYRIARMRFAARCGPLTQRDIAQRLGVSQQQVSKDLKFIRRVQREMEERDRARSVPPRSCAA